MLGPVFTFSSPSPSQAHQQEIRDRKEVGLGWRWGKSKLADARTGRPHLIFFSHLLPVGRVIIHKGKDRRGAQLLEKEKKITREVKTQETNDLPREETRLVCHSFPVSISPINCSRPRFLSLLYAQCLAECY